MSLAEPRPIKDAGSKKHHPSSLSVKKDLHEDAKRDETLSGHSAGYGGVAGLPMMLRPIGIRRSVIGVFLLVAGSLAPASAASPKPPRVLFLSKSSGFEHSSIARGAKRSSHVDDVLERLAAAENFGLVSAKDASLITAAELANIDAVVFYTTGDLTQRGTKEGVFGGDGESAMGPTGVSDLIAWVEQGGAFLGFHPAADTFHDPSGAPSPYIELLGGEFLTHGQIFPGKLQIVDTDHPTMASIPQGWTLPDEWYVYKNYNVDRIHVLALLDTSSDPLGQETYKRAPYPVIWCSAMGKGRVFYNVLGHREETWDNPIFQKAFLDALYWALGRAPLDAEPNFKVVVPGAPAGSR